MTLVIVSTIFNMLDFVTHVIDESRHCDFNLNHTLLVTRIIVDARHCMNMIFHLKKAKRIAAQYEAAS